MIRNFFHGIRPATARCLLDAIPTTGEASPATFKIVDVDENDVGVDVGVSLIFRKSQGFLTYGIVFFAPATTEPGEGEVMCTRGKRNAKMELEAAGETRNNAK